MTERNRPGAVARRFREEEYADRAREEGAGSISLHADYWNKIIRYPQKLSQRQWSVLFRAYTQEKSIVNNYNENPTPSARKQMHTQRTELLSDIQTNEAFGTNTPENSNKFQQEFEAVITESNSVSQLLLNCSLGIILGPARRHTTKHMTIEDRFQEGLAELTNVLDDYDPDSGVDYYQYATRRVRSAIFEARVQQDDEIRIPRIAQLVYLEGYSFANNYFEQHGEMPTRQAIAEHLSTMDSQPIDLHIQTAIGMIFKEIGVVPEDTVEEYLTRSMATPVDVHNVFDTVTESLTERERDILEAVFKDGVTQEIIAERMGISSMTVRRVYKNTLQKLSTDEHILDYWVQQGGEVPEVPETNEAEEKRTEFNAATLEYRLFASQYKRFLDRRTASDEYKGAVHDINRLNTKERTWFTRALISKMGREGNAKYVALQLLRGVDLEGLDSNVLTERYLWAVENQSNTSDPNLLLQSGTILAEVLQTDTQGLWDIRDTWVRAVNLNSMGSTTWDKSMGRVDDLMEHLIHADALKVEGDLESIRALAKGEIKLLRPDELDPQVQIIEKYLGDNHLWKFYHSDPAEWTTVRAEAMAAMNELTPDQSTDLAARLIRGIGNDAAWSVDRRDAAEELLSRMDLSRTDLSTLKQTYFTTVESQAGNEDPFGSPYSLARVAEIFAPHMDDQESDARSMRHAWSTYASKVQDRVSWELIKPMVDTVLSQIPTDLQGRTAEEIRDRYDEVITLYNEGSRIKDISRTVYLSEENIARRLTEAGDYGYVVNWQDTSDVVRNDRREALIIGLRAGKSIKQIHEETNYPLESLYDAKAILDKKGIDTSPTEEVLEAQQRQRDQIIQLRPHATLDEIATITGLTFNETRKIVRSLQKEGLLEKKLPGSTPHAGQSGEDRPQFSEDDISLEELNSGVDWSGDNDGPETDQQKTL